MTIPFNPAVRDFLAGRIWLRLHTPFPAETIDAHIDSPTYPNHQWHQINEDVHPIKPTISAIDVKTTTNPLHNIRLRKMRRTLHVLQALPQNGTCFILHRTHRLERGTTDLSDKPYTRLARHTDPTSTTSIRRTDRKQQQRHPHLIHAVCGSGKTEILFQPIHKLLMEGKRVCIAAPRVDVILELEPRLRAAFPETTIDALIRWCTTVRQIRTAHSRDNPSTLPIPARLRCHFCRRSRRFSLYGRRNIAKAVEKRQNPKHPSILSLRHRRTNSLRTSNEQAASQPSTAATTDTHYPSRATTPYGITAKQIRKGKLPNKAHANGQNNDLQQQRTVPHLFSSHRTHGRSGAFIPKTRPTHPSRPRITSRSERTCSSTARTKNSRTAYDDNFRTRHHDSERPSRRRRGGTTHLQQRRTHPNRRTRRRSVQLSDQAISSSSITASPTRWTMRKTKSSG